MPHLRAVMAFEKRIEMAISGFLAINCDLPL